MELPITLLADHPLQLGNFTSAHLGTFKSALTIEEEIAQLRDLDLRGLRVRWWNAFGKPAPEHLTRYLLFRIIA